MTMTKTGVLPTVEELLADPDVRIWKPTDMGGHQGDVLIERLTGDALERAVASAKTHRVLDRVLAKGSRAMHVCIGDVTVWESEGGWLLVEARSRWGIHHTDAKGHKHHPHVLPAGWYRTRQQQEATPSGVARD